MFKNLKLKTKLTLGFFIASLPILAVGYFSIYQINQISNPIKQDIPAFIRDISRKTKLSNAAQAIRYYDEVLTQAARNYAFTNNKKWKDIYGDNVNSLDGVIKTAMELGDEQDKQYFSSVNGANIALVDFETRSFNLVDQGLAPEAIKILESDEYWAQKKIYEDALGKYLARRLLIEEKTIISSQDELLVLGADVSKKTDELNKELWMLVVLCLALSLALGIFVAHSVIKRTLALKKFVGEMSAGNFSKPISVTRGDEIGQLSLAFNDMAIKLQQSRTDLERQVKARTKDLEKASVELKKALSESERMNKLMIGRELEMVKLKRDIISMKKSQINK